MSLGFNIGGVPFTPVEAPERLPIAWKQARAVNEYPGGVRTIYAMGSFPRVMRWDGWLLGPNAFPRVAQLERINAAGIQVQLAYGPFAWLGLVTEFSAQVEHQWKARYAIEFEPTIDLSGIGVLSPLALTAEAILSAALSAFDLVEGGGSGLPIDVSLVTPAANLDVAVSAGLLDSDGVVAGMSSSDVSGITGAAAVIVSTAAVVAAGANPSLASSALDLAAYAVQVAGVSSQPQRATIKLLGVVNPNLFSIAAQYLGDASQWLAVARASGISPPDPLPIGVFTIVVP